METTTGEAYRAADQPADASFFTPGVPDKVIVRSTPMWSPDGSRLAWTEYDVPEGANSMLRLVVFDTVSKTAQVIADDVPFPAGVPAAMNGDWTEAGIFLNHYEADPNTGRVSNVLLVYAPDGTRLNTVFYEETPDRIVSMAVPVQYQNQTYQAALMLTISTNQREWRMIDPLEAGAAWQPAPVAPERVAQLNPNNSLRLMWSRPPAEENYPDTATIIEEGTPVNFDLASGTWIFQPTLSPDGKSVAFTIFDPQAIAHDPSVYVWDSAAGALLSVPVDPDSFVHQLIWGAMVWEIRP
jgi:hypothetical protein